MTPRVALVAAPKLAAIVVHHVMHLRLSQRTTDRPPGLPFAAYPSALQSKTSIGIGVIWLTSLLTPGSPGVPQDLASSR